MVLTGLPADGKASFWIAPHCGFRYRKRRFYRILMLLARYDGHMNDSNTPYSKNRKITSKSQSMHGRGCENHIPCQSMYPRTRKSRIPDAQSQSTHERGHQSGVPSRNTYPRIRKNRENQSKSLLFMNGGRAKTTTNRTRRRKQPIYSIGTASKYCATPVAFAEPADSPDCIAPSKISAAAANSTVSSIKSPLFGANSPFDKP